MARSQQLEVVIAEACSDILELWIPARMAPMEKIQKLAVVVKELKEEIDKVRFELQLQISEHRLKYHPTTPPEVREQCEAAIKGEMTTLEATVKGHTQLFEQAMELCTSLQEDLTLQKIQADIGEKKRQFEEILSKMRTLAPV